MTTYLSILLVCIAQGGRDATSRDHNAEARLQFMIRKMDEFQLMLRENPAQVLTRVTQPLLHYTNPVRAIQLSDGSLFIWLNGKRPVAAACISLRGQGEVHREFTALSDKPLVCTHNGNAIWLPTSGGLLDRSFNEAPAPASSEKLRMVQLRGLANRFQATYYKPATGEATQLRLMPQPIYRFDDPAANVEDGALFAFAEANDPELLLMIEAIRSKDNKLLWRYSLARMSSLPMTVHLDEQEIWKVTAYWRSPRTPEDPYMEARFDRLPAELVADTKP